MITYSSGIEQTNKRTDQPLEANCSLVHNDKQIEMLVTQQQDARVGNTYGMIKWEQQRADLLPKPDQPNVLSKSIAHARVGQCARLVNQGSRSIRMACQFSRTSNSRNQDAQHVFHAPQPVRISNLQACADILLKTILER